MTVLMAIENGERYLHEDFDPELQDCSRWPIWPNLSMIIEGTDNLDVDNLILLYS